MKSTLKRQYLRRQRKNRNIGIVCSLVVVGGCILGPKFEHYSHYSQPETTKVTEKKTQIKTESDIDQSKYFVTCSYTPVSYSDNEDSLNLQLEAGAAILVDVDNKNVLFSKEASKHMAPASTTKLMTAITSIKILDLDQMITVGDEIAYIGEGSSTAGLSVGDKLKFKDMLAGMLLPSGNDAAYVIARAAGTALLEDNIAYDNVDITADMAIERFVKEMNKNAAGLGLEDTHFTSPDGYDDEMQYTSASDLSKIALTAYENDTIREIVGSPSISSGGFTWENTNLLLQSDSEYYWESATGMKTGSTDKAGKCLVASEMKGDRTIISVVLNSSTEGRYQDTIKLFDSVK